MDYKERMKNEYKELKAKYTKLHKMIVKHDAGTLDFKLNCPIEILKDQASTMGRYLYILEMRAEIEDVELEDVELEDRCELRKDESLCHQITDKIATDINVVCNKLRRLSL